MDTEKINRLPSPKYSCNRFQAILAQPNNSALQDWKV